jgi:hypothetical protein
MRFLRVIVNIGLCLFLIVALLFAQALVFDLLSLQSPEVDPMLPVGGEEQIGIMDLFGLWGTDIGANLVQPAKYRVRNWIDARWWVGATGWLDKAIDVVVGVTKPVVVPIAQINAIQTYTDRTIVDFIENDELIKIIQVEGKYASIDDLCRDIYDYYANIRPSEMTPEIYAALEARLGYLAEDYDTITGKSNADDATYNSWVRKDGHSAIYNNIWKINKYNSTEAYHKYLVKFVSIDEDSGHRDLKATSVVLCLTFYISIIFAIIFTIKYPIALAQGRFVGRKRKANGDIE